MAKKKRRDWLEEREEQVKVHAGVTNASGIFAPGGGARKVLREEEKIKQNNITNPNNKANELKQIVNTVRKLPNIQDFSSTITKSYNDLGAVRLLNQNKRDIEKALSDANNYVKKYGKDKNVSTTINYLKNYKGLLDKEAKGGSAATNIVIDRMNALSKGNLNGADQAEAKGQAMFNANMSEKYKNSSFKDLQKAEKDLKKTQTNEKQWVEDAKWQVGTPEELRKEYEGATKYLHDSEERLNSIDDKLKQLKTERNYTHSTTGLQARQKPNTENDKEIAKLEKEKKNLTNNRAYYSGIKDKYYNNVRVPENMEARYGNYNASQLVNAYVNDALEDNEKEYLANKISNSNEKDLVQAYRDIEGNIKKIEQNTYGFDVDDTDRQEEDLKKVQNYNAIKRKIAYNLLSDDEKENLTLSVEGNHTGLIETLRADLESKYGKNIADDVIKEGEDVTKTRINEIETEEARQEGRENPIGALFSGVGKRFAGGIGGMAEEIGRNGFFYSKERGEPIDWNTTAKQWSREGNALQEGGTETVEKFNKDIADLYQAASSMADMGLAAVATAPLNLVPVVGPSLAKSGIALIMSSEAGASAMQEAHDRGADDLTAFRYGIVTGLNEALSERASLEVLMPNIGKITSVKDLGKQLIKSYGAEGSEEIVSDLLTTAYDNMVNKENSAYNMQIKDYMSQGLTKDQATEKADKDFLEQLHDEFTIGGLAGALFGGSAGVASYGAYQLGENRQNREVGNIINDELEAGNLDQSDIEYMIDEGLNSNNPETVDEARKAQQQLQDNNIQNKQLGRLSRSLIMNGNGLQNGIDINANNDRETVIAQKGAEIDMPEEVIDIMLRSDNGTLSPQQYANDYSVFYMLGKDSTVKSLEDAVSKNPEFVNYMNDLSPQVAGVAYSQGARMVPRENVKKLLSQKPSGLFAADFEPQTEDEMYVHETLNNMAKYTGLDIILSDDMTKYQELKNIPKNTQGVSLTNEGRMILNKDTANVLGVAMHEGIHFAKQLAPEAFDTYASIVGDVLRNDLGVKGFDDHIKSIQAEYKNAGENISYYDALEEAVAYATETLALNEDAMAKVVTEVKKANIAEAQKQTILDIIKEWIDKAIQAIKDRVENVTVRSGTEAVLEGDQAKTTDALLKTFETLRKNLETAEVSEEARGESKFSMNDANRGYSGYSMSNRAVEAYENGEKPLSKWTKGDIIQELKENSELTSNQISEISKYKLKDLKDVLLDKTSWHHTSSKFNKTDFYSVMEIKDFDDVIKRLENKNIKNDIKTKDLSLSKFTDNLNAINIDKSITDFAKENGLVATRYSNEDKLLVGALNSSWSSDLVDKVKYLTDKGIEVKLKQNSNNIKLEVGNETYTLNKNDSAGVDSIIRKNINENDYYKWMKDKATSDNVKFSLAEPVIKEYEDGGVSRFIKVNNIPELSEKQWEKLFNLVRTTELKFSNTYYNNPEGLKSLITDKLKTNGKCFLDLENDTKENQEKALQILNGNDKAKDIITEKDYAYTEEINYYDDKGNRLTDEQHDFFKNSAIRNEDNDLLLVYHGSNNDFTVFDYKQARPDFDIQGMFFSGDYEEANGYGNTRAFYLNILNPANYKTAYDIFAKYQYEEDAGVKTREELISLGYDGVIAEDEDAPQYTEYIAFYPEQIKLTDNTEPTDNPDVRYSLSPEQKEISTEYNNAVANNDLDKASELVEKFAKTQGYTQKVFHGTQQFGFTKINTDKSYYGSSFYATDSLETASSYSVRDNIKKVSDKITKEELNNLSDKEIIELLSRDNNANFKIAKTDTQRKGLFMNIVNDFIKSFDNDEEAKRFFKDEEAYYTVENLKNAYNAYKKNNASIAELEKAIQDETLNDFIYGVGDDLRVKVGTMNDALKILSSKDDYFYNDNDYFFTYNKAQAIQDIERAYNSLGNYQFYANTEGMKVIDAQGNGSAKIPYNNRYYELYKLPMEEGITGYIINNVIDDGGRTNKSIKPSTVYRFFNPTEQVKSADTITYDDNGKVVPLEKRFDKNYNDIRYSLAPSQVVIAFNSNQIKSVANENPTENEDIRYSLSQTDALKRIENFRQVHEDIGRQLKLVQGSKLDAKQIRSIALNLKKQLGSKMDTVDLGIQLNQLFTLIENKKGNINNTDVMDKANQVVRDAMEQAREIDPETREIMNAIRSTKLKVTPKIKADITDYNDFRKQNFGLLRLSNDGQPIDTWASEMANQYHYPFRDIKDLPEGDILRELSDFMQTAKSGGFSMYDMEGEAAVEHYALELLNNYAATKVEDITNNKAKQRELYRNIGEMVDFAEEQQKEIKDTKLKASNRENELLAELNSKQKEIAKKLEEHKAQLEKEYQEELNYIQEEYNIKLSNKINEKNWATDEKIKRMRAEVELRKRNVHRRAEQVQARQQTRKIRDRVKKTINNPTVKKYVPKELVKPVAELFNSIDLGEQYSVARINKMRDNAMIKYSGKELKEKLKQIDEMEFKFINKLEAFDKALEDMISNAEDDSSTYFSPVINLIKGTINRVGDKSLMLMDAEELKLVNNTLRAIEKATTERTRPQTFELTDENGKKLETYEDVAKLAREQANKTDLGKLSKVLTSHMTGRNTLMAMGGFNPDSIFKQLADKFDQAYIDESQIKMDLNNIISPVLSEKANKLTLKSEVARKYGDKDLVDVGFKDKEGNPILLNHDSLIYEYLNLESDDNLNHAARGGITFPDYKSLYNRKGFKETYGKGVRTGNIDKELTAIEKRINEAYEGEDYNTYRSLVSNKATIMEARKKELRQIRQNIAAVLTEYDKKVINAWKDILKQSTEKLNEYWGKTYGFEPFTVSNYWRIVTDPNFIKGNDGGNVVQAITNLSESGSTIARQEGASNPIISGSALFAIDDYINNTAKLIAYSGLQRDLNAIMKYKLPGYENVQKTIEQKMPKISENFYTLQQDIFGGRPGTDGIGNRAISTLRGLSARSVLSPNLRVALAQLPSYLGTYRYVDAKALKNAFLPKNRVKTEVIAKYTPLMWARGASGFSLETADLKSDTNALLRGLNKVNRASNGYLYDIPNKMDTATVKRTFGAYLDYARRMFPNLREGTPEEIANGNSPLYKKAAELFNEGTMRTQPMFNTFNRNAWQRSNNELAKTLTIFHTQPFQYLNLAIQDIMEYKYEKDNGNMAKAKQAKNRALKSIASVLTANTLFVLMKMAVDKTVRHKKDELEPDYIAEQLLSSYANMFIMGSTLVDGIYSLITRGYINDFEIYGTGTINALYDFAEQAAKVLNGEKVDVKKNILNVLSGLGIPASNVDKDLGGLIRNVQDVIDNGQWDYSNETDNSRLSESAKKGQQYANGDITKDELDDYIISLNVPEGADPEAYTAKEVVKIKNKMKSTVEEQYETGAINQEEAKDILKKSDLFHPHNNYQSDSDYIDGIIAKWDIDSYKEAWLDTYGDKNGPSERAKMMKEIRKLPYDKAFPSNPNIKNAKTSEEKLIEHIKKWV